MEKTLQSKGSMEMVESIRRDLSDLGAQLSDGVNLSPQDYSSLLAYVVSLRGTIDDYANSFPFEAPKFTPPQGSLGIE